MKKSYKHLIRFIKEFIKEGGTDTLHAFQVQEFTKSIYEYYDIPYSQLIYGYSGIKDRKGGRVYTRKIPKQRDE